MFRSNRSCVIVILILILTGIVVYLWWNQPPTIKLTTDEKEWLKNNPVIKIAPNPNFIPIEFYENDSIYSGVAADFINEIENILDVHFTIVRFNNMSDIFDAAQRGEIDVITATTITEQRKNYLTFTEPFVHLQKVIVVRKNDKRSLTIDSLHNMRIAIIENSSVHERILKENIKAILDIVPSTLEGLYELSFGKVDATVANIATVSYIIERRGLSNLRIAGDFGPKDPYCIAVRKDLPLLASIMQKSLLSIPLHKKTQIIKKWTGLELQIPWYLLLPWKWISIGLVCTGIIVASILLWNVVLRRRLTEKTQELERELHKRIEAQHAFLQSEEKFHTIFYSSADANLIMINEKIVECNEAALHSLDAQKNDIIGKYLDELSPEVQPDGTRSKEKLNKILNATLERGALKFEWVLQKKSGHLVWVEITFTRIILGKDTAIYTSWRDITDRKVVEQETYRHYTQIQTLYSISQTIAQSITLSDVGSKTVEALGTLFRNSLRSIWLLNRQQHHATLFTFSDDKTNHIEYPSLKEQLENHCNTINKSFIGLLEEKQQPFIIKINQDNHSYIPFNTNIRSVLNVPMIIGSHLVGFIIIESIDENAFSEQDLQLISTLANSLAVVIENIRLIESLRNELNERKRIEEHQQKLEDQLRQIQKMESLGTLAGGIAHDFNNILGIISAYTEMLVMHKNNEERFQKYVEAIIQTTNRATDLVRQILTFARRTELQTVPVNVNELIREVTKLLSETFPKTIEITTDLQENISPILGDQGQLHQALLNLALNARDAMPNGGKLIFKTELVSKVIIASKFQKASATSYIAISISDTGIGIPQEMLQRIFEPFFTTKEKGKGTGLGLSVVYGVVSGLNGFIDVQSTVGKGTTFTIFLPAQHPCVVTPTSKQKTNTLRSGSETI